PVKADRVFSRDSYREKPMNNSALSTPRHRIAQVSAILSLAALFSSCVPPCQKSLPTPSARPVSKKALAQSTPSNFDVIADPHADANSSRDLNGILKNPIWKYQEGTDANPPHNYALKDATELSSKCFTGSKWFTDPKCTSQQPHCDLPTDAFRNAICTIGNLKFNGHMNWQAATYEGAIFWDQQATDSDFDFLLYTPNRAGMTQASCDRREGAVGVEFDSREVIDEMRLINDSSHWWRRFVAAVDQQNSAPPAKPSDAPNKMLDGRFAILTGLMGLDCEHGCTVEIHPLWALAIHAEDHKDDDEWAFMVRNWGNEGFCSHQQHYLNLLADQYTLRLPWRPQATAVEVLIDQSSYCQNFAFAPASPTQPANNVEVTFKPGEAILVKITLPGPDRGAFVLGDLHL